MNAVLSFLLSLALKYFRSNADALALHLLDLIKIGATAVLSYLAARLTGSHLDPAIITVLASVLHGLLLLFQNKPA